jgi:hypothetical protein
MAPAIGTQSDHSTNFKKREKKVCSREAQDSSEEKWGVVRFFLLLVLLSIRLIDEFRQIEDENEKENARPSWVRDYSDFLESSFGFTASSMIRPGNENEAALFVGREYSQI